MIDLNSKVKVFNTKTNKYQNLKITNPKIGLNGITNKWEHLSDLRTKNYIPYLKEITTNLDGETTLILYYKPDSFAKVHIYYNHVLKIVQQEKQNIEKAEQNLSLIENLLGNDEKIFMYYYKEFIRFVEKTEELEKDVQKQCITIIRSHPPKYSVYFKDNSIKKAFELFKKQDFVKIIQVQKQKEILSIGKSEKIIKEYENNSVSYEGYVEDLLYAEKLGFVETWNKHPFMIHKDFLTSAQLKYNQDRLYMDISYKRTINYNANSESSTFHNTIRKYYHSKNGFRKTLLENFPIVKALKGLTFGVELETSKGGLPRENYLDVLGLIPLKDGSISSWEYATVPYGMKIVQPENNLLDGYKLEPDPKEMVKDIRNFYYGCQMLSKYSLTDNKCSLHVHFGNTMKTKNFIIAFYLVCRQLQEELFEMQPYYKHDGPKYIGLKKNYCKKLPKLFEDNSLLQINSTKTKEEYDEIINYHYNIIFQFLSNGEPLGPKYNRTCKKHPLGKKWERTERYNWINIVNTVFNQEETIEFRLHSGTLNAQKIMNWILICAAIINFTQNNIKEILGATVQINLHNILQGYSTNFRSKKKTTPYGIFLTDYLLKYVEERKQFFQKLKQKEDFAGKEDYMYDKTYKYSYQTPTGVITDLVKV